MTMTESPFEGNVVESGGEIGFNPNLDEDKIMPAANRPENEHVLWDMHADIAAGDIPMKPEAGPDAQLFPPAPRTVSAEDRQRAGWPDTATSEIGKAGLAEARRAIAEAIDVHAAKTNPGSSKTA